MRIDHPSSMRCDPAAHAEEGCITCGDVAVPLRVVEIDEERELALCEDEGGRRETVEIGLVTPVARGEGVLVHAGTAIAGAPAEAIEWPASGAR